MFWSEGVDAGRGMIDPKGGAARTHVAHMSHAWVFAMSECCPAQRVAPFVSTGGGLGWCRARTAHSPITAGTAHDAALRVTACEAIIARIDHFWAVRPTSRRDVRHFSVAKELTTRARAAAAAALGNTTNSMIAKTEEHEDEE